MLVFSHADRVSRSLFDFFRSKRVISDVSFTIFSYFSFPFLFVLTFLCFCFSTGSFCCFTGLCLFVWPLQSFRHPEPEVAPTCWRFRAKDDVTSTWPSYVRSVHSIAQRQVSLVTSDYVLVWGNMNEVSCWFLCFKCSTNVFFALYG